MDTGGASEERLPALPVTKSPGDLDFGWHFSVSRGETKKFLVEAFACA
jgi:hypothetical protein